ncbi:MAG: glycosyltransferase family 2 protein [Pseudomonadales bacterium]|nr:glycosyltransferase family 2 protein [Candidatus Woesebacteria bacterium]MCB9802204.1 glycosyltransferase family 2 protein [Pseudomonadales bacterium]
MSTQQPSLSIVINTKNAGETLKACLQSVAHLGAEIIVVDMHSSDDSIQIATTYGAHTYFHNDLGYVEPARNFALSKAKGEWILVLDADEEVSASLADQLPTLIKNRDVSAYAIPRKNIIFGAWIAHTGWWPDYQTRLFKNGSVSWYNGIHRQPDVKGELVQLAPTEKNALLHHNYPSIESYLERLERYTSISAGEDTAPVQPLSETQVIEAFSSEFFSRLFAKEGLKDGTHGVLLSLLQSMYQVVEQAKVWQAHDFVVSKTDVDITLEALTHVARDLHYWIAEYRVRESKGLIKLYWRVRRKLGV